MRTEEEIKNQKKELIGHINDANTNDFIVLGMHLALSWVLEEEPFTKNYDDLFKLPDCTKKDLFVHRGDIHKETMDINKVSRQEAKAINFGELYGQGTIN